MKVVNAALFALLAGTFALSGDISARADEPAIPDPVVRRQVVRRPVVVQQKTKITKVVVRRVERRYDDDAAFGYQGRGWGYAVKRTSFGDRTSEVYFPYYGRSYDYWPYRSRHPRFAVEPAASGLTEGALLDWDQDRYEVNRCFPALGARLVGPSGHVIDRQRYSCSGFAFSQN